MEFEVKPRTFGLAVALWLCPIASAANVPPTGDQTRSYEFAETGQTMPYRLYVPTTYSPEFAYPLVVVLHGGGNNQDQPFEVSNLREEAERRGVIVVSPLGYNRFSAYGNVFPILSRKTTAAARLTLRETSASDDPSKPLPSRSSQRGVPAVIEDGEEINAALVTDPVAGLRGERDVMTVISLIEREYTVDPGRIYLMGNSMGALGVQYLGAKYPERFAAIAPAAGPLVAWSYPYHRLANNRVGVLYIHGDQDEVSHAYWSEMLHQFAKRNGVDSSLMIVEGGNHSQAWSNVLGATLDYLLDYRKDGARELK